MVIRSRTSEKRSRGSIPFATITPPLTATDGYNLLCVNCRSHIPGSDTKAIFHLRSVENEKMKYKTRELGGLPTVRTSQSSRTLPDIN